MVRTLSAVASALALVACGGRPIHPDAASPVPPARVLAFNNPGEGATPVHVTRDALLAPVSCLQAVYVGHQLAARIDLGESATLHLQPGAYTFSNGTDPHAQGLCSTGADAVRPAIPVHVGSDPIYLRLGLAAGGAGVILQQVAAPETARK